MGFVPRLVTDAGAAPVPLDGAEEAQARPAAPPATVDASLLAEVLRVALDQRRSGDADDGELEFRLELKADAAHEAVLLLRVLVVLEGLLALLLLRSILL